MKNKIINLTFWILGAGVLVLADQYTKILAVLHLKGQNPYVIWDGVFELFYSENRGAAFGMLQGRQSFFFLITMIVLAVAGYAMWKMPSWSNKRYLPLKLCVIFITAGALGNMIDRVTQGFVVDFLYFKLIDFPIFNMADIYVTVSTAALLCCISFYYKEEELAFFQWSNENKEEQG